MKKIFAVIAAVVLAAVVMVGGIATAAPGNGQKTCPTSDGWVKFDGLSGHTFTLPDAVAENATVENCVKYATTVVYGTGVTVVSDGKHEISHASFKVTVPDEPTDPPTDEPTEPPTDEPTDPVDPEKPEPVIQVFEDSVYHCGDAFETLVVITQTTDYVLVDGEWVLGETVTEREFYEVSHPVEPCGPKDPGNDLENPVEDPEKPQDNPDRPGTQRNNVQVPTAVDAGI